MLIIYRSLSYAGLYFISILRFSLTIMCMHADIEEWKRGADSEAAKPAKPGKNAKAKEEEGEELEDQEVLRQKQLRELLSKFDEVDLTPNHSSYHLAARSCDVFHDVDIEARFAKDTPGCHCILTLSLWPPCQAEEAVVDHEDFAFTGCLGAPGHKRQATQKVSSCPARMFTGNWRVPLVGETLQQETKFD